MTDQTAREASILFMNKCLTTSLLLDSCIRVADLGAVFYLYIENNLFFMG